MDKALSQDPDYRVWVLLHQARDVLHKVREREVAEYGITAVQSAVLFVIYSNEGKVTPTLISNWLLREPHTISSIISRMEKLGLVEKTKKPGPNAELSITLTEKGRQAYHKIENIDLIREMLSCLSEEERKQLGSLLKRLRDKGLSYLLLQKITFP